MELTEEIIHDDNAFAEWLNQTFDSEKVAEWMAKQRDQTLEYMEKVAANKLPNNFFDQAAGPPFDPQADKHDGAMTCPYGDCNEAGRRTGFIRIERYKPKRDEYVDVMVYCRCHPGYKKYGDQYGASQEEIDNSGEDADDKHPIDEPEQSAQELIEEEFDDENTEDDIPF